MGIREAKDTTDADVQAMNEVYKIARSDADAEIAKLKSQIEGIKAEQFARGALQKIKYDAAHDKMMWYAIIYNLRQNRAYLDAGMNWEEFCESIGEDRRTTERVLDDLSPLFQAFSSEAGILTGMPFNKIRRLGRSLAGNLTALEDGALVIDGERIPLDPEHKEDLEAAIDALVDRQKKAIEEKDIVIKAKDRHLGEKEKVIQKQEKELAKLTRTLEARGFKPGEEEFLGEIENLRTAFGLIAGKLDPESVADFVHPERGGTERAKAAYMGLVQTIARYAHGLWNDAQLIFGDPELDGGWTQPESPAQGVPDPNPDTPSSGKPGLTIIK